MPDESLTDWLLTCIEGEGATLRDIIAYVDFRNHSILTYEEFIASLNALWPTGKIDRQGPLLRFTPAAAGLDKPPLFSKDEFTIAVNEYSSNSQ